MFLYVVYLRFIISGFLFALCSGSNFFEITHDQTTSRANTLLDDADDIQRQLDNEARDRIKFGRPKTIWVFHLPTQFPDFSSVENVTRRLRDNRSLRRRVKSKRRQKLYTKLKISVEATKDWSYKDQGNWSTWFPECGGRSQSPVDMPYKGLILAHGARKLLMKNYDVKPDSLTLTNDGRRVTLVGKWPKDKHPYIYGGAAHSRRYLFHSMTLHWPSEHTVGGLQYPLESQAMHVSAEYCTMEKALKASVSDPLAFLAVASVYRYGNHTQKGLEDLINVAATNKGFHSVVMEPTPLIHFSPPMTEYACYQGSLTAPPCTEAVLWLVRGRTLSITREMVEAVQSLTTEHFGRYVQPMNDRKAYFFKN